ncbi:ankyrin repeat domain-containing protein [Neisseria sp. 83E34]|uniref:ankyrin repeat domain-containing protein n=1 Tax=Neisseria sp. 83E34 TaxID=1692264 RepID=UPI0006CE6627|nr:ankyrin repeat domain-containing protein [Neisseria sp. 83E34]KPN70584.1 ankyrin [Neisseria sp. 83E34]
MSNDPYENDIGMQITRANRLGDIAFLQKMADTGQFNPLHITESERWNYLHRANLINPSPVETVKFYLDKGVEVNAQDVYGMTPLHYAMRAKNGDAALALLEAGADPNIPNIDNTIPLAMIGGMPERLDVLEKMLQCGADVHYKSGNSGLEILELIKTYFSEEAAFKAIIAIMEKYA